MPDSEQNDLARLTVDLLSAYFANNSVPSSELSGLIEQTRTALAGGTASASSSETVHTPAVSIEDSIASRDHILSLLDGKPYKSLKRHLANNGLTPAEYRARYGLPGDYPMVAPSYSEHRRAVAQRMGLGGRPNKAKAPTAKAVTEPVAPVKEVAAKPAKEAPAKEQASKSAPSKAKAGAEKKEAVKPVAAAKPRKRFAREPKAAAQDAAKVTRDAAIQTPTKTTSEAPKAKAKTPRRKAATAPKETVPAATSASPAAAVSSDATVKPASTKKAKAAKNSAGTAGAKTASATPRPRRAKAEAVEAPGK